MRPLQGGAKGTVPLVAGLCVAALLAGLLGFSSTLNPLDALLGRGAIVTVPDLSGRPQPGAEADVRALGLVPEVRTSYSLSGPRGTVIAQDPPPGSRVREGSTIEVVVSRGINRVEMPDAVGAPFAEVVAPLEDAGIEIEVERTASETAPKDVVIAQDPGPGVLVTGEDVVRFTVSDGPAPRPVPDVSRLALEGAAFELGKAGFEIGTITEADDANAVVGSILRTDPPAGTVADRDTPVDLVQAAGPPPVSVPNVVGQAADAAADAVSRLGLVPNVIRRGAGGAVTTQDPAPATTLRPGAVVTLEVGGGG
jgi:beta-lactam-binding protein with PASTA domain